MFLSQLYVNLLTILGCFWKIQLSKICDESNVWVGVLCNVAGYVLPSTRLWTNYLLQKIEVLLLGWSFRNWKILASLQLAKNWNISTKVWQNILFLSTFPISLRCYAKVNWKSWVFAGSKLWIHWFFKKQRYKMFVNIWRFLWRDLQLKSLFWPCHRWETSGSEHNLH